MNNLTLCLLDDFLCLFFFVVCVFFSKSTFLKNSLRNTIRVSNSSDPDDSPNCLQRLSADDTRRQRVKDLLGVLYGGVKLSQ